MALPEARGEGGPARPAIQARGWRGAARSCTSWPRPERVNPGREGQDPLRLVAAADQHTPPAPAGAAVSSATSRLLPMPASPLRTTRRPRPATAPSSHSSSRARSRSRPISGGSPAAGGSGLRPALPFGVAGRRRRLALRDRPARAAAPAQDLLVEGLRLRFGLGPELPLERRSRRADTGAGPRRAVRCCGVEPHQRPVNGLLQRVEREESQRGLDGRLGRARDRCWARSRARASRASLAQALALGQEPVLERRLLDREARRGGRPGRGAAASVERARATSRRPAARTPPRPRSPRRDQGPPCRHRAGGATSASRRHFRSA